MNSSASNGMASIFDRIRKARKRLGCTHSGAIYRGHGDVAWSLTPGLFRQPPPRDAENNLFEGFVALGHSFHARHKSGWEILADMQHHGVPTRFLDWTQSFATALYFAMRNPRQPCVWVMNAFSFTKKSTGRNELLNLRADTDMDYLGDVVRAGRWPYSRPVAVFAPWANPRIHAQQGLFTLHGTDSRPIEIQSPSSAIKIEIPQDTWDEAREFLELSGTTEFRLFPDADGLARFLRHAVLHQSL